MIPSQLAQTLLIHRQKYPKSQNASRVDTSLFYKQKVNCGKPVANFKSPSLLGNWFQIKSKVSKRTSSTNIMRSRPLVARMIPCDTDDSRSVGQNIVDSPSEISEISKCLKRRHISFLQTKSELWNTCRQLQIAITFREIGSRSKAKSLNTRARPVLYVRGLI